MILRRIIGCRSEALFGKNNVIFQLQERHLLRSERQYWTNVPGEFLVAIPHEKIEFIGHALANMRDP